MNLLDMEPGLATTMSGGPLEPVEHPEAGPVMLLELMGEGSIIEKNPTPVASIVADKIAAEAILQRLSETAEGAADDEGRDGKRFVPYTLIGEPEEIYGGIRVIDGDAEGANAFIRKLIGSVQRPSDEEQASAEAQEPAAGEDLQPEDDGETGRGKAMMLALRRGRLGKIIAGAAVVSAGALYWASSASAETLEQQCIDAGMKPMALKAAKMHGAHKDDGNGWYGRVRGRLDAMPQECTDNGIYRVLNGRVMLQNGEHRARWSMIFPWIGSEWNGHRNNKGFVDNDAAYGYGAAFQNSSYQHNHNWTRWAYICSPGPEDTGARYDEEHTVIRTNATIGEDKSHITGDIQVLASRTIERSIQVDGAC